MLGAGGGAPGRGRRARPWRRGRGRRGGGAAGEGRVGAGEADEEGAFGVGGLGHRCRRCAGGTVRRGGDSGTVVGEIAAGHWLVGPPVKPGGDTEEGGGGRMGEPLRIG